MKNCVCAHVNEEDCPEDKGLLNLLQYCISYDCVL